MSRGILTRYAPGPVNELEDVRLELIKLSHTLNAVIDGYKEVRHAEPEKIQDGMVVVADGTDWNPGSGAGLYINLSGTWTKL